jgi:outer membrane lipoprotein-sorting protein
MAGHATTEETDPVIDRRLALAAVIGWCLLGPAAALALTEEEQALARRAAAYLDDLAVATGRFTQTSANGAASSGTFWLQRPGRARFDYDAPSGLRLAADGHVVTVVDTRLGTIHSYPLRATPMSLFLARHVALDEGARVQAVTQTPDAFSVVVRDGRGKTQGSIALDFRRAPLTLEGWTATDGRGAKIRVRLQSLQRSSPRPGDFFVLRDPGLPAPGARPPAGLSPAN